MSHTLTRWRIALGVGAVMAAPIALAVLGAMRGSAPPAPATFALVAYTADAEGALHAETLDSGLTPDDCAFGLGAAARLPMPDEVLITCALETGR